MICYLQQVKLLEFIIYLHTWNLASCYLVMQQYGTHSQRYMQSYIVGGIEGELNLYVIILEFNIKLTTFLEYKI